MVEQTVHIKITSKAYMKIKQNSFKAWPNEWGGLLLVKDVIVNDVLEFKQEANGVYFQIDEEDLSNFMIDLMENDPDKLKEIKGWVHCHPMIGWSGIDNNTFERLLNTFGDYCVGIVDQYARRLRARIDIRSGDKVIIHDDIGFDIVEDIADYYKNLNLCCVDEV